MQLAFRLDKRPGESHMALDGKEKVSQPARPEHAQFAALIFADVCWPIVRVLAVNVVEKRLSEIKPDWTAWCGVLK